MKPYCVITHWRDFVEGTHYRLFSKEERKRLNNHALKAVYLVDVLMPRETNVRHDYHCIQGGRLWGTIRPDGVLIKAGYAWNFNSKSPDFIGKFSSGGHDLLFQFSGCFYFPRAIIDRKWADDFYFHFCEKSLAWAYRLGLFLGSWAAWGNEPRHGEFVEPAR
jgi:hypothetical protein